MASLYKAGAGWMLQWSDRAGGRRSVRLPKMPRKAADSVLAHVQAVLAAKAGNYSIPLETARWAAGLLPPRTRAKLGAFLTEYAATRIDLKSSTRFVRAQSEQSLPQHFGDQRELHSITPGDAEGFRLYLVGRKLAPSTIHKRVQTARQAFKAAVRCKLVDSNLGW